MQRVEEHFTCNRSGRFVNHETQMSGESEATKIDQTEGRLSVNILLLYYTDTECIGKPKYFLSEY